MNRRALFPVLLTVGLALTAAACGRKGPLEPPPGGKDIPARRMPSLLTGRKQAGAVSTRSASGPNARRRSIRRRTPSCSTPSCKNPRRPGLRHDAPFRVQTRRHARRRRRSARYRARRRHALLCYSTATLQRHYRVFSEAFADTDALTCYAMKANSNQAVIATLAREGAGMDIVSRGELRRALAAGVPV